MGANSLQLPEPRQIPRASIQGAPQEEALMSLGAGAGSKRDLGSHIRAGPEIGPPILFTAGQGHKQMGNLRNNKELFVWTITQGCKRQPLNRAYCPNQPGSPAAAAASVQPLPPSPH